MLTRWSLFKNKYLTLCQLFLHCKQEWTDFAYKLILSVSFLYCSFFSNSCGFLQMWDRWTDSLTLDRIMWDRRTDSLTLDRIMWDRRTDSLTLDRIMWDRWTDSLTLDRIMWDRRTDSLTLDRIMWDRRTDSLTLDRIMWDRRTDSLTLDRIIFIQLCKTFMEYKPVDLRHIHNDVLVFVSKIHIYKFTWWRYNIYMYLATIAFFLYICKAISKHMTSPMAIRGMDIYYSKSPFTYCVRNMHTRHMPLVKGGNYIIRVHIHIMRKLVWREDGQQIYNVHGKSGGLNQWKR